uniref:Ubiquitin-conjugating enzyme E2 R2 n=1 Tax=Oncorhynchus kisutch TaxID=8019 RepID=A0A8C7F8T9_ONCKI
MAHHSTPSSQKALMMELKSLQEQPVEGFRIGLVEESNLYNWEVAIFGPPNTLYEGGYFKSFLHPEFDFFVFQQNGDVCISILHPPVDDPQSGELPSERWNPTQNIRTILLSVISLLNEPNTFSPANVDASVMFRKWRDSKGKDKEYAEIIRKQVVSTVAEAERDGVKVPTTLAEYCVQTRVPSQDSSSDLLYDDLYDDDMEEEEEEDEDEESDMESGGEAGGTSGGEGGVTTGCYDDDQEDSGNEDS